MDMQFEWWHGAFLVLAVVLEILANILLKMSNGFKRYWLGILSLLAVLGAFSSLAQAVKGIELSIAYALWGRLGLSRQLPRDGYFSTKDSTTRVGAALRYCY